MRILRCPNLDIDKRNNFGVTALMKAAIHNHSTCVDMLFNAGKLIPRVMHYVKYSKR